MSAEEMSMSDDCIWDVTTTPEDMQGCVDAWIKGISEGVRALKNIKASVKAPYIDQAQKDAITRSVLRIKAALDDPVFRAERFAHPWMGT